MSDYVTISVGCPPWQPTEDSVVVEVLHEFTIPLIGVFEQHGSKYLFWCVVGHAFSENAWAYGGISDPEIGELKDASPESFNEVLKKVTENRVCVFAIASEEKGVVESVELDPPASFTTAHSCGMRILHLKLQKALEEMNSLYEQFPGLQTASEFSLAPSPAA
jgi:hypothetical protein